MTSMGNNLLSPNTILTPCRLDDLSSWLQQELNQVSDVPLKGVIQEVADHLTVFVRWPFEAILLWRGCDRIVERGKKTKYHSFPGPVKSLAKAKRVRLDRRANGPAIASFRLAGGERPPRYGSSNAWSVHHLYSGKFPYLGRTSTTHAAKESNHFTQSAGLVAIHPLADALVDEFPFFAWILRAHAFLRFGYDPDCVFSEAIDDLGFANGRHCLIICPDSQVSP